MAGISYESTHVYISDIHSNIQAIRSAVDKRAALVVFLEPQLSSAFTIPDVRNTIIGMLAEYFTAYDAVIRNADQGDGVKFNIPWEAVATYNVAAITTSSIRNRRPRPLPFPDRPLVFIPFRP